MANVKIVADYREKASGIPSMLASLNVKVDYRNLTVADYVLPNDYAVERKQVGDFLSSMISGRLFDQAYRLTETYPTAIFIVEGDWQEALNTFSKPKALWGALASLTLTYRGRLFFTVDNLQTAELLTVIAQQAAEEKKAEPVVKERRKIATVSERQLHIVASLQGVGPKLADKMLKRFGTVRNVFKASSRSLSLVKGLGKSKANSIGALLDSSYAPSGNRQRLQKCLDESA